MRLSPARRDALARVLDRFCGSATRENDNNNTLEGFWGRFEGSENMIDAQRRETMGESDGSDGGDHHPLLRERERERESTGQREIVALWMCGRTRVGVE